MEDWNAMMAGRAFITDLGNARAMEQDGASAAPGRYAVWSPLKGGQGHTVVEVGESLEKLMERYQIPAERVCLLVRT